MHRLLITAALLGPAPALAAPCTAPGLTGMWRLVQIRAADPQIEAFYANVPHEVWRFGADRSFVYVAGNRPYTAATARQSLDRADAGDGVSYRFAIEGGSLMLARDGQPWEGFQCRIADRAEGAAQRGDLILTNLPGRPAVQRIQRRLG